MTAETDDGHGEAGVDAARTGSSGRRLWPAWLFIVVFATYLFTGAGQFQTVDAAQELGAAVSLRHGNGLRSDFPVGAGGGTTIGRHGDAFAAHDIGATLLYLPFTLIPGTAVRTTTPSPAGGHTHDETSPTTTSTGHDQLRPSKRGYFAASFLAPLLGALIVVVFAFVLDELGFDAVTVTVTSLALAFTTTVWVYAHVSFDSTAVALAVLAAVWGAVRFQRRSTPMDALVVGGCLAAGVLVRSDTLVMVPFLALPVLIGVYRQRQEHTGAPVRTLIAVGAPLVAAVAVNLAYNWYRFGSITDNGHADDGFLQFNPRIAEGLFGQIASPGKGLLVFSPLVIVALFRWRWFLRRHAPIAGSIAAACAATLVAHAAIVGWAGDQAWGSRFTVVVVPLLAIPLARVVDELRHGRIGVPGRLGIAMATLAGFVVQITGVFVDFFAVVVARRLRGEDTATSMTHAAYLDGLVVLWHAIGSVQPYRDLTPAWIESLHVARLDLWWVRTAQVSGWNLFTVGVPAALVAIAVWAGVGLHRSVTDAAG